MWWRKYSLRALVLDLRALVLEVDRKAGQILMVEKDLEAKLAKLETDTAAAVANQQALSQALRDQITALQGQVTSGTAATPDQIQALSDTVDRIDAAIAPLLPTPPVTPDAAPTDGAPV